MKVKLANTLFISFNLLVIIGNFLPLIYINKNIYFITGNGKVVIFFCILSILLFILKKWKLSIIPTFASLILIFKFHIDYSHNFNILFINYRLGLYTMIIGLLILMIIPNLVHESKFKLCPHCGATVLKDKDTCFLCDANIN